MNRIDARSTVFRFGATTLVTLLCIFSWCALLSFSISDWPSTAAFPSPDEPQNLCGRVGGHLAYTMYYYFGAGAYAVLMALTLLALGLSKGLRFSDPWLRLLGAALVCAACSTAGRLFLHENERWPLAGPGGVLGVAAAGMLTQYLSYWGTLLMLLAAMMIGLLLAADNFVIALAQWLGILGRHAAPILREGGAGMAQAGAAAVAAIGSAGAAFLSSVRGRALDTELEGSRPRRAAKKRTPDDFAAEEADDVDDGPDPAQAESDETDEIEIAPRRGRPRSERRKPATTAIDSDDEESDEAESDRPDASTEARGVSSPPGGTRFVAETPAPPAKSVARVIPPPAPRLPFPPNHDPRPRPINYELPPLTMLDDPPPLDQDSITRSCREKAETLQRTLKEFRLDVEVVRIDTGPVITMFELQLTAGIKVSQIQSLANDLARALKAPAVRVVAPIPGRSTVGIEVPNIDKEKVRIKEIMQHFGAKADAMAIPLYLGKDASGEPLVCDLTRMPHSLIAGTTGSGKSVCVTSIVMSILMTRSPEDVKLILIDPKVVELAMFKDIPHLMCPIVTEMPKAESILDWAATKMDERYALLAEAGVKDIRSYNRLGIEGLKERMTIASDEEMAHIPVKLPYIVIVVDELADLMMTSAKEVEFYLCRIAQKSRAVGIHLIVSTQRPQANVVTGLIKANLPCRVSFRVSSRLDSRIVLDQNGGEVLMGQGDMLFLPPGSSKLLRAQGTFVSDEELRAIVKHARAQGEPQFSPELVRLPGASAANDERDELFDQAVDIMMETRRGSVSLLQRRLTIGYGRASRLIDQMYASGIVGEYKGSQAREVLLTKEEWEAVKAQRDAEERSESGDLLENA